MLLLHRGFNALLAGVVGIVLVRYLGPGEYGLLTTAYSYVSFFVLLGSLGVDTVVRRDVARDQSRADDIVGRAIGLRIVLSLGALLLALAALPLLGSSGRVGVLVALIGLSFPFSFYSFYLVLYAVNLRMGRPTAVMAAWALALSVLKLLLIAVRQPVEVFAALEALSAFVVYRLARWLGRGSGLRPRITFKAEAWAPLLKEAWPIALALALIQIYLRVDQVMLFRMAGTDVVGRYGAAVRLVEFANLVPAVLMASAFPVLARLFVESEDRLQSATTFTVRAVLWVGVPVACTLGLHADLAMSLLFGDPFLAAVPALRILAWTVPFAFVNSVLYNRLFLSGHQKSAALVAAGSAGLNVILNLILIPRLGAAGAALASLVAYGLVVPFALLVRSIRDVAFRVVRAYLRPSLAGAMTVAAAVVVDPPPLVGAFVVPVLGVVCLVLVGEIGRDELRVVRAGWRSGRTT